MAILEENFGKVGIILGEERLFVTSLPFFLVNQSGAETSALGAEIQSLSALSLRR